MGTKRKSPPALAELCHDALAEGVLARHDGLPESWIAMFKAHPAAWAQLQQAVLAPNEHFICDGRELTEESTVFVSWCTGPANFLARDGHDHFLYDNDQFVAPAAALPKSLFFLLQARLKMWPPDGSQSHARDGTGGYSFVFRHPEDVVEVWKEICERLPNEDHSPDADSSDCGVADKAMLDIFLAVSYESDEGDLVDVLAEKLSLDPVVVAVHIETTIRSNRNAAADVITEALHNPSLLWSAVCEVEIDHANNNRAASYFRAPALSLHFDFTHWNDRRPR